MKIVSFIVHYARELTNVASALRSVVQALPIDHGDRARINDTIDDLIKGAEAAVKGASAVGTDISKVVVKASDVKAAVAAYLESPAGQKALAAAVKPAPAQAARS